MPPYLENLGIALDALLNSVFGGSPTQTISMRAALAEEKGRLWGCWLCWWLSRTVERGHCVKTLAGTSLHPAASVRAGLQLIIVATLLYWLARFLILSL